MLFFSLQHQHLKNKPEEVYTIFQKLPPKDELKLNASRAYLPLPIPRAVPEGLRDAEGPGPGPGPLAGLSGLCSCGSANSSKL